MKRFWAKCLLLALIVTGILAAGGEAYRHTTAYQNLEYNDDTVKYHHVPKTIEFAIVGASQGRDAFPNFYLDQETSFNFALSSQTPVYDWMILREFQDRIQPGAVVVLTMSYITPYYEEDEKSFEQKQERYYRILSPWNIVDVDVAHWALQRLSPLLTNSLPVVTAAFFRPESLIEDPLIAAGINELSSEILQTEQERISNTHVTPIMSDFPQVNTETWDAYHQILRMCEENGWQAVVFTPPYLEDYRNCFPIGFYEKFCRQVESLCSKYNVLWLDYSHDPAFSDAYAYFKNIDHLNFLGAQVLMKKFEENLIR